MPTPIVESTHFKSLEHAKQFCTEFFYQYNYIHRQSGIGWHTPASVHFGTADAIDDARRTTLTAAFHANPARFPTHRPGPTRPGSTNPNQPYPNKLNTRVPLDLTDSGRRPTFFLAGSASTPGGQYCPGSWTFRS